MEGASGDSPAAAAPADKIFLARQPIFDPQQKLFAYELLYRGSFDNVYAGSDGTSATLNVLRDAFLVLGPQLIGSRKAFVNFNTDLLRRKLPLVLNPKTTVIEILEDVEVDEEMVQICRELKSAGYVIALDDFTLKLETPGSAPRPGGHRKGRFPRDEPGRKTGDSEGALGGKDRVPRGEGGDARRIRGGPGRRLPLLSGLLLRQAGHRVGKEHPRQQDQLRAHALGDQPGGDGSSRAWRGSSRGTPISASPF